MAKNRSRTHAFMGINVPLSTKAGKHEIVSRAVTGAGTADELSSRADFKSQIISNFTPGRHWAESVPSSHVLKSADENIRVSLPRLLRDALGRRSALFHKGS